MISADSEPGIESELVDLSAVSLERLRELNSSAFHQAMHNVLTRTGQLRNDKGSNAESAGERID